MTVAVPVKQGTVAKRCLDLALIGVALVFVAPVLAGLAAVIWLVLGSPVFFRQLRPGLNGKVFRIVKFRSMSDCRESGGRSLPDKERLGRFGRFLRSTSLDELPELWNVLTGDMSLVGPRPLLVEYLSRYDERQWRRHDVKPGITGWAQIHGRNELSWEQKFELDLWYVDNRNLWLDIRILWLTLLKVWQREGISQQGHATMSKFMGSTEETGPV